MTITGGTALSKDEIDRMQKEAEAFAAEDHKRREAAEARNHGGQPHLPGRQGARPSTATRCRPSEQRGRARRRTTT